MKQYIDHLLLLYIRLSAVNMSLSWVSAPLLDFWINCFSGSEKWKTRLGSNKYINHVHSLWASTLLMMPFPSCLRFESRLINATFMIAFPRPCPKAMLPLWPLKLHSKLSIQTSLRSSYILSHIIVTCPWVFFLPKRRNILILCVCLIAPTIVKCLMN